MDWGARGRLLWLLPLGLCVLLVVLPVYARLGSDGRWLTYRGYELVMGEDRLVEWVQFLVLLGTAFYATRLAISLGQRARRKLGVWNKSVVVLSAVAAFGFILLACEEISWGQRIFGLSTPPELARINAQGELNLHNLHGLRPYLNGLMIAGSTGFLLLSLARPRWVLRMLLPAFLVTPLYWLTRLGTVGFDPAFVIRNGEWAELSLGVGLCLATRYAFLSLRHQTAVNWMPVAVARHGLRNVS
ncbi:MAG: hypothetical protein ACI82F_001713 [Planctomycetota bacterium]|jgi:hypothetical protein